ncbi:pleckstrin domain-containing protein [Cavenderia fasciculata]|uniref:Pleckstrin domain-containing protein n=1 Tax=Cavenderia fasciculata TaxID=261658 RepID=F4Q156_CACFS|nr:pleckstrin domain-containing protein [Cavenderia fasciculata]EGG18557.1 pleckstrin domain-containing protein [Cavenderia fasciculata]|eukprot:XP_004366461.1 pleckstrin domain-containing protein [Cavenderia fasciculata]
MNAEIEESKRKTAPPSVLLPQGGDQQQPRVIGVAPLRTSHILKPGTVPTTSGLVSASGGVGVGGNVGGGSAQIKTTPPKRVASVSVSASASSENLLHHDHNQGQQQQPSPSPSPSIVNSKSTSSGNLASLPLKPPAKTPPKTAPRSSTSMSNLNVHSHIGGDSSPNNSSPTRISMSPNTSSNSLLSPDTSSVISKRLSDDGSDSNSTLGDSSFIEDGTLIENKEEDSDDETDEEEEELHENFLKELGLGNKERINDLKEQEKKELELLAGGNRFRVTRCFVMAPTNNPAPPTSNHHHHPVGGAPPNTGNRPPLSSSPNAGGGGSPSQQIRKSVLNNNANQQQQHPNGPSAAVIAAFGGGQNGGVGAPGQPKLNRQTIFNPRFSIYRPGPTSAHAPPKKPLPPPPSRKLPPTPKTYTKEQEQAAIKIQKCYRRYKQMIPFRKLKILYRYRWNIVQEIYNTERTYLNTLGQLSAHFIDPLRKSDIVSQDDVKFIFGGLDSIIAINTQLMFDVENILKSWTPYSILGKCFCTLGVYLKAYTDYVKNFDFSLQRIEACSKDIKFTSFIKQAEEKTVPRSRLESLLITPVQRIPRYVLLLQDLLKHTESSHPDFTHISEGLDIIKKVAISINDTKRRADNSLKVIEVQNKLVGKFPNLVVADRRYVHEGYVSQLGHSKEKTKKLYIFLFNDIMIFSKPSSNKLFSKAKFKFVKIEDLFPSPKIVDIPSNPMYQSCIEIELRSSTFTLQTENEDSKKIWFDHFTKVFGDINNQYDISDKLEKRAVERAGQAKTYIDNYFANIKVKGRAVRGATIRSNPNEAIAGEEDKQMEIGVAGGAGQLEQASGNGGSSGVGVGASGSESPLSQSQQQIQRQASGGNGGPNAGLLTRQQTFHNMTLLQREERLKGMAEETSQLKMEHMRMESTPSPPNGSPSTTDKYGTVRASNGSTMGRATLSKADLESVIANNDGTSSLQEKKPKSGPPSLNKIFSSINLNKSSSSSSDSDKKGTTKPPIGKPPAGAPLFPTMSKQVSSLNVSLNAEIANSISKRPNV